MREIKFEYVVKAEIGNLNIHCVYLDLNWLDEDFDNSLYYLIDDELERINEDFCSCSFNESQNHCDCDCGNWSGDFEIIAKRQYTGLKDVNGLEIYEGDIVKWGHIEKFEECWHRVAFVELFPCLQFHIINYIEGKTLEYKKGDNYIFGYSNFIYKNTHEAMEVIGNIYENPELLGE